MKFDVCKVSLPGAVCRLKKCQSIGQYRRQLLSGMTGLCLGFFAFNANAAFQLLEDFDSLTPGNINGQNSWFDSGNSGQVVIDPANNANQTLSVIAESAVLHRALTVPQDSARMLFLRFRFEEHGEYSFGLSHVLDPDEFNDFGPELGMASSTFGNPSNELRVANGSTTGVYDELEMLTTDTWYNVWVMVKAGTDTYQVWLNSDSDSAADDTDLLDNAAAESVFGFRTMRDADLLNFFIKTGAGNSPIDGRFYLDDIYIENTDTVNLNFPSISTGEDSNSDGIPDADALALGLDPVDSDGDTDNDGQSDIIEVGGDVTAPLDSDVDGIIDALEPGTTATDATVASGLKLPNDVSVTITTSEGQMLSQVGAAPISEELVDTSFPYGLITYTTTATLGATERVRLRFSEELPADVLMYSQDNAGVLAPLASDDWLIVDSATVDLSQTDGEAATDLDQVENGIIEAAVAAAIKTAPTSSSSGGGGCSVSTGGRTDSGMALLLLGFLGYGWLKRCQRKQAL